METTTVTTDYYSNRVAEIKRLHDEGKLEPYPHKFEVTREFAAFKKEYDHLEKGAHLADVVVRIAGRITEIRNASNKLQFYDVANDGESLQVIANLKFHVDGGDGEEKYKAIVALLSRGDIVGIVGHPARSKSGELSVMSTQLILLSPCYHMVPFTGKLTDTETRHRARYLDLIVNPERVAVFKTRARIIAFIRDFFNKRGCVEVETPMMSCLPGGANARPFVTHHNDLHANMFLRVAPELYLKQLIIAGFNGVYEIGKNFRNEGIDLTHNPEFTAIEVYRAYDDFFDVLQMTEDLFSSLVLEIHGTHKVNYVLKDGSPCVIDFTPPWRRVSMIEELERLLGVSFPEDLSSSETNELLKKIHADKGLTCEQPHTTPRLLDNLVGEYIESQLVNPGFIIEHPQLMSPLAKPHRDKKGLTERFELFVAKRELCNAYTEMNDPFLQRKMFLNEAKGRDDGDDEAQPVDENFCTALEYGLPPTGGWGCGIDRLCMILTGQTSIKEVLLFPAMRPLDREREAQQKMMGDVFKFTAARFTEKK